MTSLLSLVCIEYTVMKRLESLLLSVCPLCQPKERPTNTITNIEFFEPTPATKTTVDEIVKRGQQVKENLEARNAKSKQRTERRILEKETRRLLSPEIQTLGYLRRL
jgi:hypothetical protein